MKRGRVFSCVAIAIFVTVTTIVLSCNNFGIPETIAVKTNATYSFEFGMDTLDMGEYLSVDTLKKSFGEDNDFKVYDYNPGGNTVEQHFLVEYPAVNYPLDISEIFDSMNFGNKIGEKMEFSKTFSVPDLNMNQTISKHADPSSNIIPVDLTLDVNTSSDSLIEATIAEGKLVLSVAKPSDASWSGITAKPNLTLSGGITMQDGNNVAVNNDASVSPQYLVYATVDLQDKIFKPQDIKLIGKITLAPNAPSAAEITMNIEMNVATFSSAKINLGETNTEFVNPQAMPYNLKKFVKTINYKEAGVSFNYTNTLPNVSSNEVTMTVTSSFLNFPNPSGKTGTLLPGGANVNSKVVENNKTIAVAGYNDIDINVKLNLPDSEDVGGETYITIKNVKPNKEYTLAMSDFEFILDWESIVADTANISVGQGEPEKTDLPFDINKMFSEMTKGMEGMSELVEAIQLPDIPIYIYMAKPDMINLNAVNGTLKVKGDNNQSADLLKESDVIYPVNKALPIPEAGVVMQDLALVQELMPLNEKVFSQAFNERWENLKLEYKFKFDGNNNDLSITKQQVDAIKAAGGVLSIKAAIYIDIPLRMTVGKEANINMMKLAGTQSKIDLLGRDKPMSTSEFYNYFNAIKSVNMSLNVGKDMFINGDNGYVKFIIDDKGNGDVLGRKEFTLPELYLGFNDDEISGVLKSKPPYMPGILINLPTGSGFVIFRNANLNLSGKVIVATDGTITLFGGE